MIENDRTADDGDFGDFTATTGEAESVIVDDPAAEDMDDFGAFGDAQQSNEVSNPAKANEEGEAMIENDRTADDGDLGDFKDSTVEAETAVIDDPAAEDMDAFGAFGDALQSNEVSNPAKANEEGEAMIEHNQTTDDEDFKDSTVEAESAVIDDPAAEDMDDFGAFGDAQQSNEVSNPTKGNEKIQSIGPVIEDNTASKDRDFGGFEDADFGGFEESKAEAKSAANDDPTAEGMDAFGTFGDNQQATQSIGPVIEHNTASEDEDFGDFEDADFGDFEEPKFETESADIDDPAAQGIDTFGAFGDAQESKNEGTKSIGPVIEDNTASDEGDFGDFEDADFGHFGHNESPAMEGDQTQTHDVSKRNEGFGTFSAGLSAGMSNLRVDQKDSVESTSTTLTNTQQERYLERAASVFKQIFRFEEIMTFEDEDTISMDQTMKTNTRGETEGESSQHTTSPKVEVKKMRAHIESEESYDARDEEEKSNNEEGDKDTSESSLSCPSSEVEAQREPNTNSERLDDARESEDKAKGNKGGSESSQHTPQDMEVGHMEVIANSKELVYYSRELEESKDKEVVQVEDDSECSMDLSSESVRNQTELKLDNGKDLKESKDDSKGISIDIAGANAKADDNNASRKNMPTTFKDILVSYRKNQLSILLTLLIL